MPSFLRLGRAATGLSTALLIAGCSPTAPKPAVVPPPNEQECFPERPPTRATPPPGSNTAPPFDLMWPVAGAGHEVPDVQRKIHAQELAAAGDHVGALAKAERLLQLSRAPAVYLFIAWEQRALGMLGEAYESASQCLRTSEQIGKKLIPACTEFVAQLEPLIGFVTLAIPSGVKVERARIAGRWPNTLSEHLAVAPGDVEIEALANDTCYRTRVHVVAQQSVTVTVDMMGKGFAPIAPR